MFEIRKNLDLRKILYTPKIFLKSRFYCSASCAHTTSTPNQKFIYNQDFSAMLDRIPGICCFYAPNWLRGLLKATQVRSLVPTKSLLTIKTFMLCQIEFQNFDVSKGQLISKAIYGLLTSPKKQMDGFVLFVFLLFMTNKSNSSIRFLGESTARQSAF